VIGFLGISQAWRVAPKCNQLLDCLMQQVFLQLFTLIFSPQFSDYSFGSQLGRNAHQAFETVVASLVTWR
jgi:hypothetical protein